MNNSLKDFDAISFYHLISKILVYLSKGEYCEEEQAKHITVPYEINGLDVDIDILKSVINCYIDIREEAGEEIIIDSIYTHDNCWNMWKVDEECRDQMYINNLNTIVSGVVCNDCKEVLPPHTHEEHTNIEFMKSFHKCSKDDHLNSVENS